MNMKRKKDNIDSEKLKEMSEKLKKSTKKRKTKNLIKRMVLSFAYLLVFALIGVWLAFNSVYGNPDKTVQRVFESYAGFNWNQVYQLSNTADSEFINKKTFGLVMSYQYIDVSSSSLVNNGVTENGDNVCIDISYSANNLEYTDKINLIQTGEKVYKFFPVWKVDLSDKIVNNATVNVPKGYTLFVDDIKVSDTYLTESTDEIYDVYCIDRLFSGTHKIVCKKEGMYDVTDYIQISEVIPNYKVDESKIVVVDTLYENAPKLVFSLYQECMEQNGIDNLMTYFDEASRDRLQEIYDELHAQVYAEDGSYLKIIENVEYDVVVADSVAGESVDVIVDFSCTFWAKTKANYYTGVKKDYEGTAEDRVVVHFIVDENGGYIATDMEIQCIDYSQRETVEEN